MTDVTGVAAKTLRHTGQLGQGTQGLNGDGEAAVRVRRPDVDHRIEPALQRGGVADFESRL
jgi:hypothetical protein